KIIEVTDKHRNIARIVSQQGLLVPDSASEKVMEALSNVSSFMTVHSAIAVDTSAVNGAGGIKDLIGEVAAQPQVYAQLIPLGAGFRLALFVKPFGSQGPYMKPGQGAENVMAEVGGQRLQTRRDLNLEEKKVQELVALCPTLADLEETGREWLLQETDICLQVLLELQEARDEITVEWPEGARVAVRSVGSTANLKMRIHGKQRHQGLSWFEMSGELELDEALVLDMKRLVELARKNPGRFLPLGDGEFLALTDEFRRRLDDIAFFTEMESGKDPAGQKLMVHPLAAIALEESIENIETDQAWQKQQQLIREAQLLNPKVPSTLQAELRDYQVEGYKWLSRLAYWGGGACLADDMGLGKTLQALAIILEKTECGPILVVAPTSVCMNWLHEANRFAPTLNTHLLSSRNRKKMVQGLKQFDVLVTSYTLLQQEAKLLAGVDWQIIVLDEAQAIKNMETKRSRAAMSLNGKFKLLTTGTPIENNLSELWNLFNFIIPGLLGSLQSFNQRFAIPIERFGDQVARRKLKRLIRPFILRRNKSQVLEELPPRTEIVLQVEMNKEESAFYEALRRQALDNLNVAAPAVAGRPAIRNTPSAARNKRNNGKGYTIKILAEIMKLRRACCNPRLVMPDTTVESSKLFLFGKVVDELLENRHKALVFSQFVGHLNIMRAFLDNKGIEYRYLDGSTPMKVRKQEVDAFQAGHGDLFLISLKAGGLGLNLTAADYVIHMDPWWNPAVEDQASDRVHRIGQKHPVTIYRLIIKHTIEEKIVNLHREKRDLANSLLADTDISSRVSVEELLSLIREQ
ncbi:MAG: DEAD/DEAH box helicase, partial [Proteobacteria bacterium]|nr:DEAD/DEAH box helicase [Pseudomonadota bacterium]